MEMVKVTVIGTPESSRRIILAHTAIASPHALLTFKAVRNAARRLEILRDV
jgi:hypothetical protein